jgi:hypothetical protein
VVSLAKSASVDSVFPGATAGNVQSDKAINHGQFALVQNREKAVHCVEFEIRYRHLAARNETCNSRKQAKKDQDSAAKFHDAANEQPWIVKLGLTAEHAKQFLRAMTGEKETENQAQKRVRKNFEFAQEFQCASLGGWML